MAREAFIAREIEMDGKSIYVGMKYEATAHRTFFMQVYKENSLS